MSFVSYVEKSDRELSGVQSTIYINNKKIFNRKIKWTSHAYNHKFCYLEFSLIQLKFKYNSNEKWNVTIISISRDTYIEFFNVQKHAVVATFVQRDNVNHSILYAPAVR